jgi:hypothetical protein
VAELIDGVGARDFCPLAKKQSSSLTKPFSEGAKTAGNDFVSTSVKSIKRRE